MRFHSPSDLRRATRMQSTRLVGIKSISILSLYIPRLPVSQTIQIFLPLFQKTTIVSVSALQCPMQSCIEKVHQQNKTILISISSETRLGLGPLNRCPIYSLKVLIQHWRLFPTKEGDGEDFQAALNRYGFKKSKGLVLNLWAYDRIAGKTLLRYFYVELDRYPFSSTLPIITKQIETYLFVVGPAIIIEGWLWLQGLFS